MDDDDDVSDWHITEHLALGAIYPLPHAHAVHITVCMHGAHERISIECSI